MSPASRSKNLHEALMLLNGAFVEHKNTFKEHSAQEEGRFASIEESLKKFSGIEVSLARIEGNQSSLDKVLGVVMADLKKDVERLETHVEALDKRMVTLERWKWTMTGTIPLLTALALWVLKHVFNVQF
jgi:predicted nuclease with TOPRIM domain